MNLSINLRLLQSLEPTGQNNSHDNTNTVPDPSQDNTGKQEENKTLVETPKTIAQ